MGDQERKKYWESTHVYIVMIVVSSGRAHSRATRKDSNPQEWPAGLATDVQTKRCRLDRAFGSSSTEECWGRR